MIRITEGIGIFLHWRVGCLSYELTFSSISAIDMLRSGKGMAILIVLFRYNFARQKISIEVV